MAGFTQAYSQTILDWALPTTAAGDHIAYSANGTTETSALVRTPIGATGWAAATAATPSVKANANALTSAASTSGTTTTITHFAIFSALSAGVQKTDWKTFDTPRSLELGDQITHAVGAIKVTQD